MSADRVQYSDLQDVSSSRFSQYIPMKVPDKITLDQGIRGEPPVSDPSRSRESNFVPQPSSMTGNRFEGERGIAQVEKIPAAADAGLHPSQPDISERIEQLEGKVQSLEERLTRMDMGTVTNRFWYVVTFSSWMMVPLVAAFFFYHRRYHSN